MYHTQVDADGDGYCDGGVDNNHDGDCTDSGDIMYAEDETAPDSVIDCDLTDATIYPGATEIWGDGIDQDCDGSDSSLAKLQDAATCSSGQEACFRDVDGDGSYETLLMVTTQLYGMPASASVYENGYGTGCGIDGVPIAAVIARAVATIGMAAVFFQDMFGLITFDGGFQHVRAVRPRIGKGQVIHCLNAYQQEPGVQKVKQAGSLSTTIAALLRRTSLVPVVSDFLFEKPQDVLQELSQLHSTHDVFLVLVDSAFAFELPRVSSGWIETVDIETGRSRLMSRTALRALANRMRGWQDEVERMARDLDLDVLRFGIDPVKSEVSLAEFVAERRLRKM